MEEELELKNTTQHGFDGKASEDTMISEGCICETVKKKKCKCKSHEQYPNKTGKSITIEGDIVCICPMGRPRCNCEPNNCTCGMDNVRVRAKGNCLCPAGKCICVENFYLEKGCICPLGECKCGGVCPLCLTKDCSCKTRGGCSKCGKSVCACPPSVCLPSVCVCSKTICICGSREKPICECGKIICKCGAITRDDCICDQTACICGDRVEPVCICADSLTICACGEEPVDSCVCGLKTCVCKDINEETPKSCMSEHQEYIFTVKERTEEYLRKRRIPDFLNFMMAHLLSAMPDNPIYYLIDLLDACMLFRAGIAEPPLIYKERHLQSIVKSFDPAGTGYLTYNQYKRAFVTLGVYDFDSQPMIGEDGKIPADFFIKEVKALLSDKLRRMLGLIQEENESETVSDESSFGPPQICLQHSCQLLTDSKSKIRSPLPAPK